MTHYITVQVSITVLIMVTESQDVCSTTTTQLSYTSWEACTLHSRYFKSALFEIPLHRPVSCIPVGHSLYTLLTRPFSLFCRSGSGLRDSAIASGWAGWVLAQHSSSFQQIAGMGSYTLCRKSMVIPAFLNSADTCLFEVQIQSVQTTYPLHSVYLKDFQVLNSEKCQQSELYINVHLSTISQSFHCE